MDSTYWARGHVNNLGCINWDSSFARGAHSLLRLTTRTSDISETPFWSGKSLIQGGYYVANKHLRDSEIMIWHVPSSSRGGDWSLRKWQLSFIISPIYSLCFNETFRTCYLRKTCHNSCHLLRISVSRLNAKGIAWQIVSSFFSLFTAMYSNYAVQIARQTSRRGCIRYWWH